MTNQNRHFDTVATLKLLRVKSAVVGNDANNVSSLQPIMNKQKNIIRFIKTF